ncbi:hypothetical protein PV327_008833 [Microctonus hyperodae]|uniref:Uncharacterized protein n=1 Tax=Microctonus hyperodae TaxID=165561 RepID=A0AA39FSJ4_MICHY|nr:hypothetical protein PV327_008833 [Microctonus hyperodae]
MELSDTDVLCERHFRECDIIREDEIILKNGVKYKSRRDILKLAPNTIPIKIPNDNEVIDRIETNSVDYKTSPVNCEESNIENSETNSKNVTISREITNDDTIIALGESIEEAKTDIINVPDIISSKTDEKVSSDDETIVDTSELEYLKIIKENLPPEWHVNKYFDTIELSHINPHTFEIKKQIKILPDMSMQVIINNYVTKIENLRPMESIDDLCKNVFTIHNLLLCCGIGIDNMRSNKCLIVVEPSPYTAFNHIRCEMCKKVRRKMLSNLSLQKKLTTQLKVTNKTLNKLIQCYSNENKELQCKVFYDLEAGEKI